MKLKLKGYEMETKALEHLEAHDFQLICRNFYCRQGEIDLIGILDRCLIFVEVRYRKTSGFGTAAETISVTKQRKILHCAQYFLKMAPQYSNLSCRFDVIAITLLQGNLKIDWITDAFRPL